MTQADKIRNLLAKGMTAKEIATKLGIPVQNVYNISFRDKKSKKAGKKVAGKRGRPAKVEAKVEAKIEATPAAPEPQEIPFVQQFRNRIEDLEKERRHFIAELKATDRLCSDLVQANLFLLKLMQKDAATV